MRARPRPNPRRGLLRAALVIICLVALLLVAIAVVSSLTAPAARAPTVPTPPALTPPPRTTPAPTAAPTKHRDIALAPVAAPATHASSGRMSGEAHPGTAVRSPHGSSLAYFAGSSDAYAATPLYVVHRPGARAQRIGWGDGLSSPVWDNTGNTLLYVRVKPQRGVPGALWSVLETTPATGRTRLVDQIEALNVTPLGVVRSGVLYAVARSAATSLYAARPEDGRGRHLVGILLPQAVTHAYLSPDGRYVAVDAPEGCSWCTVDTYNLATTQLWSGPSGTSNDRDLAWSSDGSHLAALVGNRLMLARPDGSSLRWYGAPPGLPRTWSRSYTLSIRGSRVRLTDRAANLTYQTDATALAV